MSASITRTSKPWLPSRRCSSWTVWPKNTMGITHVRRATKWPQQPRPPNLWLMVKLHAARPKLALLERIFFYLLANLIFLALGRINEWVGWTVCALLMTNPVWDFIGIWAIAVNHKRTSWKNRKKAYANGKPCLRIVFLIEGIDWLIWVIDWSTDWMTHWLTDGLMDGLIDWLIEWIDLLDWSTDWLIDRLIDWLIDGLNDSLTDWWIDGLIDWQIDWFMGLINWLIDWQIDWLNGFINWLIDWLIDW